MDAAAAIVDIVASHPEIRHIAVIEIIIPPLLQERVAPAPEEATLLEVGLKLRDETDMPFWDALLLSSFRAKSPPTGLLNASSFHNPSAQGITLLDRSDINVHRLRELGQDLAPHRILAVSSEVELNDGSLRHIPLLDFHCPSSPRHLALVRAVLLQLNAGDGFLLESGKSYHFYGVGLLTQDELFHFLGRALLFSPIVDRAWIAHQLIESRCALRISARGGTGGPPQVVMKVNAEHPYSERGA
jgi:hypothetical protein